MTSQTNYQPKNLSLSFIFWVTPFLLLAAPLSVKAECPSSILEQVNRITVILLHDDDSTGGQEFAGSGTLLRQDNSASYILTVSHVVSSRVKDYTVLQKLPDRIIPLGSSSIMRTTSGRQFIDESRDIAFLKFLKLISDNQSRIPIGSINTLQSQDRVYASGNPAAQAGEAKVQELACNSGSFLEIIQGKLGNYEGPFLKYDAVVVPGMSGGPVLNREGALIGINQGGTKRENPEPVGVPITTFQALAPDELKPLLATSVSTSPPNPIVPPAPPAPSPSPPVLNPSPPTPPTASTNLSNLKISQDTSITSNTPITDKYFPTPIPAYSPPEYSKANLLWSSRISECLDKGLKYVRETDESGQPVAATDTSGVMVLNANDKVVCPP